jgi:hypothetical protein
MMLTSQHNYQVQYTSANYWIFEAYTGSYKTMASSTAGLQMLVVDVTFSK